MPVFLFEHHSPLTQQHTSYDWESRPAISLRVVVPSDRACLLDPVLMLRRIILSHTSFGKFACASPRQVAPLLLAHEICLENHAVKSLNGIAVLNHDA